MKKFIPILLSFLSFSAFAGETDVIGLLTLSCQAKDQPNIQVEVFNKVQDLTDGHVYAKNPMGFFGTATEKKTAANHLIVDLPVVSAKDSITLDVDLTAHPCQPDAVISDSFGNSYKMSCLYNSSSCIE